MTVTAASSRMSKKRVSCGSVVVMGQPLRTCSWKKGITDFFFQAEDGIRDKLVTGVQTSALPISEEPLPTNALYPYLPEFVDRVLAFAKQSDLQYDVIHSHYWLSGWVAEKLRDAWNVPFLQMFHTLGLMKNRIALSPAEHEPDLRIQTERKIIQSADYLVAATPGERIQMMWLYGADMRKLRVIPPGVDVQHFCPMPKAEAKEIVGIPENNRMLLF